MMHEMDLKLADVSILLLGNTYHLEVNLPVAKIVGFIHPLDSNLEKCFYKIYILLCTIM